LTRAEVLVVLANLQEAAIWAVRGVQTKSSAEKSVGDRWYLQMAPSRVMQKLCNNCQDSRSIARPEAEMLKSREVSKWLVDCSGIVHEGRALLKPEHRLDEVSSKR